MAMNIENSKLSDPFVDEAVVSSYVDAQSVTVDTEASVEETAPVAKVKTDDELATELADVQLETVPEISIEQNQKHLSKEEAKIVALKKQNQKLLDDYRELARKIEEIEESNKQVELRKEYIDKGIDEEEAERYVKKDLESVKTMKKLEMLEFKLDNSDVLMMYPESKVDLVRIMNTAKTSGMTVEQVCRGLYGVAESLKDTRAKAAAKGELEDSDDSTSTVASAQRTSVNTKPVTTLSRQDVEAKQRFENAFRGGEKMSNQEWLDRINKYNLKTK